MSVSNGFRNFAARLRELIDLRARGPNALPFRELALELFDLQFQHNEPFQTHCRARRVTPESVDDWTQIPALPTAAFKAFEVTCLASADRTTVFLSSGTTRQTPSRHFHNQASLEIYEASLLPWFAEHLFSEHERVAVDETPLLENGKPRRIDPRLRNGAGSPSNTPAGSLPHGSGPGVAQKIRMLSLTPAPFQAPHSSLVYMCEAVRRAVGSADSRFLGLTDAQGAWHLDLAAAHAALREVVSRREPVLLLGTAFSFVQLLDSLVERNLGFALPAGSRVMETGGYKGRSREVTRPQLHSLITERLAVSPALIISEYGMSEISSQAYDAVVSTPQPEPRTAGRVFRFPPWVRIRVISPETGREVAPGETGMLQIFDLANVYSVMAVQTEDLVIRRQDGFQMIGRSPQTEPRGCSLMPAALP